MTNKFLQNVQSALVSSQMLKEVSVAVDLAVQEANGQPIGDPMFIALRTFKDWKLDSFTLLAVLYRMEALANLVEAGSLREWQLPGVDQNGAVSISTNVFHAAASARLIISKKRDISPVFDLKQFKQLALAAAEPEGRG